MSNKYRTIYCGCVTEENINSEIKLAGWIENIRDHGGCLLYTSPSPRDI